MMADPVVSEPAPRETLKPLKSAGKAAASSPLGLYCTFFSVVCVVLRHWSDRDHSFCLTLGAGLQCLGLGLLLQQVHKQRSVAGLSGKMIEMQTLSLIFRLSSTLIHEGYLPIDSSGDYVYQAFDLVALCFAVQLLWCVQKTYLLTYQAEYDTMQVWKAVPVFMFLAVSLHGNLNRSRFFDATWTLGMHMETIAMLPQYWMFVQKGGEINALASHYAGCIFVARICSFSFWYYAHRALKPKAKDGGGPNIAGYIVVASHTLQLLLSADFIYHYVRSAMKNVKMIVPQGNYDV